ncbi:hypothetical protein QJ48_30970 [Paenibacillus sp. A3]|nr:hypothetical protein QJ48_30970 [Paenibacillus sp. A3]
MSGDSRITPVSPLGLMNRILNTSMLSPAPFSSSSSPASYSVKLVDHTGSDASWLDGLEKKIQSVFDECMKGSSHKVVVSWGKGVATDNLVLHFVQDVDHSYIQQKMPGAPIKEDIGGHTRTQGKVVGSEIYKLAGPRGDRRQHTYTGYSKLALHESLHNLYNWWSDSQLHGSLGGGGLAAAVPQLPPTALNKELIQRGLNIKTKDQLL